MEPRFKDQDFRHEFKYRIRSHECDRQGVVHNARYLEILEIARIEYCRDVLKIPMDAGTFASHHRFYFVRNAMDYFAPARFDDDIIVRTRIARLGRTSVTLEQLIDSQGGRRLLEAEAVMVSVDEANDQPRLLDIALQQKAREWEGRTL